MLLRIDELNSLKTDIERNLGNKSKLTDLMDDWLMLAYADGKTDVEDQLHGETNAAIERITDVVGAVVGGKTVFERIEDDLDSIEDLYMLFENERQRVYNTAANDTAEDLGAKFKTWHCQMLPTSRDTHIYLNGMTKPMEEAFYTYNGNSAMYPGSFNEPSEDINCLCFLTYTK